LNVGLIAQVVDDLCDVERQENALLTNLDIRRHVEEMTVDGWTGFSNRLTEANHVLSKSKEAIRFAPSSKQPERWNWSTLIVVQERRRGPQ
jgi:hypothetical protein